MTGNVAPTCDNETDRRGAGNASTVLTHQLDLGERGLGVSLPSNEEWRPIPGYEGLYEVSDQARVRNAKGRILSPTIAPYGHRQFRLHRDGVRKSFGLHRLILMAFVRLPVGGEEGRHLNGDPSDNRIENLAWGSHADNMQDMIRHGRHRQLEKTHCPKGHRYDGSHIRLKVVPGGVSAGRICYGCQIERTACPNCGKSIQLRGLPEHQRSIRCQLGRLPSKRQPINHGTIGGHHAHYARGVPMCEPCRQARIDRYGPRTKANREESV